MYFGWRWDGCYDICYTNLALFVALIVWFVIMSSFFQKWERGKHVPSEGRCLIKRKRQQVVSLKEHNLLPIIRAEEQIKSKLCNLAPDKQIYSVYVAYIHNTVVVYICG